MEEGMLQPMGWKRGCSPFPCFHPLRGCAGKVWVDGVNVGESGHHGRALRAWWMCYLGLLPILVILTEKKTKQLPTVWKCAKWNILSKGACVMVSARGVTSGMVGQGNRGAIAIVTHADGQLFPLQAQKDWKTTHALPNWWKASAKWQTRWVIQVPCQIRLIFHADADGHQKTSIPLWVWGAALQRDAGARRKWSSRLFWAVSPESAGKKANNR